MAFDINPPNRNLSNVQASQGSCPGGGGNTGYFKRGKKEEENEEFKLEFAKDMQSDSFEKKSEDRETQENFLDIVFNFINSVIDSIKKFFSIKTEEKEIEEKPKIIEDNLYLF